MNRNWRLPLAALAMLPLSAVAAGSAQAANFTASKYPTTVTAESAKGNDALTTEAGTVECKSHFEGTLTAAAETLTVNPKYSECKAFGFLTMTIEMRSCDYVFHTSGAVDIICTNSAEPIKLVASTCTATIGEQKGLTTMELANGAGDITEKANLTGIAYTVTNDGFACPFNGTGAKTGATFKQGSAVTVSSTNGATIDIG